MINTFPELILSKVCEYYNVDKKKVKSLSRRADLVKARQVYSFICSSITELTRERVGEIINRDHSSISHAISKINQLTDVYPGFKTEIKHITDLIESCSCTIEVKDVNLLLQAEMNSKFLESWAI